MHSDFSNASPESAKTPTDVASDSVSPEGDGGHIPSQSPSASQPHQGWSLGDRDPNTIRAWMPWLEWFYRYYFRVQTEGWEQVPEHGPVLFVGSHNGGIASPDLHMCLYDWFRRFGADRPAYGLMHPKVWTVSPRLATAASKWGAVRAHPKMAIAALKQGASVLVYPGGAQDVFRPHHQRHQICLNGRKGFIKLALRHNVPIVPLVSTGAHDTLYVMGDCYDQAKQLHDWGLFPWLMDIDPEVFPVYIGWPWGLTFGPLPNIPWPQPIRTRVCSPLVFDRHGRAALKDKTYVDRCYQIVVDHMQANLDDLVRQGTRP